MGEELRIKFRAMDTTSQVPFNDKNQMRYSFSIFGSFIKKRSESYLS
jgi:hypothetical protein